MLNITNGNSVSSYIGTLFITPGVAALTGNDFDQGFNAGPS